MKKIFLKIIILAIVLLPATVFGAGNANISGYILLQIERHGEAWYVYPDNGNRYYLGRPNDAFVIMKKLALGAKHNYIANTTIFPARLSGQILLDVDKNGEAYYIYPKDYKKYPLGRPADAFRIMSQLGLGISNAKLDNIPLGDINNITASNPLDNKVLQSVPFTTQAPFSGWGDLRQQDGCEEASSLMAVKWARGQELTATGALQKITGASDYILNKYGEYRDVSPVDTVNWIIKDYFNYPNAAVKYSASLSDIIAELNKGNVIIAPMNGQLLHNPYYTAPGPLNHMLVIRGYDVARNVFITNDPGTRRGELYEYDAQLLYNSIRAYLTGNLESVGTIKKDVIVIWK